MGSGLRRVSLRLVSFLLIVTLLHPAGAQDQDADANQKKARATLDAMVTALGGQRWLTLTSSMQQGRTSGFYQGKPTGDIMDFWDYRLYPDRQRIELTKKRDWLEIVDGNQVWEVTYRGKKAIPKDQTDDMLRRRDHSLEVAIKVWLKDPKTVLLYDGQSMVERHLADQVTLISAGNDSITIQMGTQDHLPLRRSFQWRDPLYKDKNEDSEEYDDYHPVDGIPTPFTITRFHNGDMTNQRFLYRASYNSGLEASLFDPDAAAQKIKK
jgi:hypothetical protein